ncbi:MAG: hypothetical protein AB1649_18265, partial [Chloroflexota bacterium]
EITRATKPSTDPTFLSPEMQKKRHEAATEFMQAFQERIPLVGGKPHAGTILAVAARLAGTSLFRYINKKEFTPGVIVLSEEVNQAYPQLLNLFAFYCKENGIDVMAKPVVTQFPENDKPRMTVEQVQAEYQDTYDAIMKKHGLDYLNAARAGMVVCSFAFQYHGVRVKDIDPYVATGIVAMGVVEGAKTAPPRFGSKSGMSRQTEKGVKHGRLVLGPRDAAIQEALDTGGEFIDVNPGILEALKARGIDPYLVHEQALKKQMEEKIDRIDFVRADVDALFNEWKSKTLTSAPEYVRLIFWLKSNASAHGYKQSGNSWVFKS